MEHLSLFRAKKRYIRANPYLFTKKKKKMSKEIMRSSRLRYKVLNTKGVTDRRAYNKQRNHVFSLLRNEKKNFCSNFDTKIVTDKRMFCKTVTLFLSEIRWNYGILLNVERVLIILFKNNNENNSGVVRLNQIISKLPLRNAPEFHLITWC